MGSSNGGVAGGDKIPKGYEIGQVQQFDQRQNKLYNNLFSHVGKNSNLQRLAGGDEALFQEMEAPAWRDFQQAQGQLANRFSQLSPGAMNAQGGSGFKLASGQLGSDFAMKLQANRQDLMRQALNDLMGMSDKLLNQKPTDRFLYEKPQSQKGPLGGWGSTLGAIGGGAAGFFAGGPAGAFAGANIGSQAFAGL